MNRTGLPMTDHQEYEVNWCLPTAEEIAITASKYADQPSKEDWVLLKALFHRMEQNVRVPLQVEVEGEDG